MALVGGGGAPNVAGSNPTGIGSTLNYYRTEEGTFVYAYAGLFDSATSEFTLLSFTTGDRLIKGEFILNGSVLFTADSHLGGNTAYKINANEQTISTTKIDTTGTDVGMPMTNVQPVILAPYTKIVLSAISGENSSTEQITAYFIGRVY